MMKPSQRAANTVLAGQQNNPTGALSGLRVLDLTDHKAHLCARLLADMGADVIKVEPPGGDEGRRVGPFVGDLPHPDRSLFFWFYNFNKRSLTLSLEHRRGRELFEQLVRGCDVVVESHRPGWMSAMGLGWERLHDLNPALVLCSIAPFGQTGPRRGFEADDTVLTALSGMLFVNGFPAERPLRPLGLQAYHSASYYGAVAVMMALIARERDGGVGQRIDLSMQEATVASLEQVAAVYFAERRIQRRAGSLHWTRFFRVGRCRDGYVMHSAMGDWTSLIEWVKADGKARDLDHPEWNDYAYRREHAEHIFDVLDDWIKDYPRDELVARAQALRLSYASVRGPEELFADEQLKARGYFVEVEHPELGRSFLYPGPPYRFERSAWRIYRRPPLLGEHTGEILRDDAGVSTGELAALAAEGVI